MVVQMDLNLLRAFPSLHDFMNWIDIWFPEKRREVISELNKVGLLDYPVPLEVFAKHIMVHFYWKMVRYRCSRRNLRSRFLHELDGDFD